MLKNKSTSGADIDSVYKFVLATYVHVFASEKKASTGAFSTSIELPQARQFYKWGKACVRTPSFPKPAFPPPTLLFRLTLQLQGNRTSETFFLVICIFCFTSQSTFALADVNVQSKMTQQCGKNENKHKSVSRETKKDFLFCRKFVRLVFICRDL